MALHGLGECAVGETHQLGKPTGAFIGASWIAWDLGMGVHFKGPWNADLLL